MAYGRDDRRADGRLVQGAARRRAVGSANGRYQKAYAGIAEYGHVLGASFLPADWEETFKDDPTLAWRYNSPLRNKTGELPRVSNSMTSRARSRK